MLGIEMLYHDVADVVLGRQVWQKMAQRFQPTGGGSDPHHDQLVFCQSRRRALFGVRVTFLLAS
ncbi:MAG: hypothetical protein WA970_25415 [Gammaproteobacteria bacterium]